MFLPQILILFFFIGLLENTGYMARAAFIMDRLMSRVGLNGKSFIPLLSSYACAIPGIMATRTIEDPKDRLTTILVAPLMSCSARLPVYLLMIAALLPGNRVPVGTKVGLMLLMYALGTLGAFGFAWLFKRYLLKGAPPLMIMELPPYRLPRLKDVLLHMLERAGLFLRRAGTVILGISIVLWFLTAYPKHAGDVTPQQQIAHSFAGTAGRLLEPAIKPLGFDWRIGIGLVSSFAAREVFVSSMAVVFSVDNFHGGKTRRRDAAAPFAGRRRLAGWGPAVHPAGLPHAHDLLRVRDAVHQHGGRREARNQLVALAAVPDRLHDRHGVAGVPRRLPSRPNAGILKRGHYDPPCKARKKTATRGDYFLWVHSMCGVVICP